MDSVVISQREIYLQTPFWNELLVHSWHVFSAGLCPEGSGWDQKV